MIIKSTIPINSQALSSSSINVEKYLTDKVAIAFAKELVKNAPELIKKKSVGLSEGPQFIDTMWELEAIVISPKTLQIILDSIKYHVNCNAILNIFLNKY